ncbi:MAG: hypothetical protein U0Z75_05635 [Deinococcaceae bacterium]
MNVHTDSHRTPTVLVRDVVNWQDDAAMDQSAFKWFDAQGRLIRTIRHSRIKLTQGAAVDSHCLWITGVAYNPYARPKSTQETETISCIDLKSNAVKDYFIPGFQGVHPSVSPTTGKVFVGCATGPKVAVIQNGKATVINLKQYFPQIDSGLKRTRSYLSIKGSYYQTINMEDGSIGIIKIDERSNKPTKLKVFPGRSIGSIYEFKGDLYAVNREIQKDKNFYLSRMDLNLEEKSKKLLPKGIYGYEIFHMNEKGLYFLSEDGKTVFFADLKTFSPKKLFSFSQTISSSDQIVVHKDQIYVGSQVGGQDLTILNLKTGSKKTIKAAQSMDGLESL